MKAVFRREAAPVGEVAPNAGAATSKRVGVRTITVEEAGRRLGISRSAAYRCVERREIPALRLGRFWKVPIDAFDRMLATGQSPEAAGDG
jgi:excisionase family DNA binding protein